MNVRTLILIFSLFVPTVFLCAQVDLQIDTLKQELDTIVDDSTLVITYNKLGELYIYNNPDSALKYLQLAGDKSISSGLYFEHAKSQLLMAIRWEGISEYDSALLYNDKAYRSFLELRDTVFMGNALSNIGLINEALGRKQEGLNYHLQALSLFQAANDSLGIAKTYNNLGILFKTLGDYRKASKYYQQSASIFAEMNYRFGQAALLNNAASAQLEYAAYDSALINSRAALDIYTQEGIDQYLPSALEVIGTAWYKLGEYEAAIDTLQLALELHRDYDNQKEGSLVLRRLAECHKELGQLSSAKAMADSSLIMAQDVNSLDEIADAALVLSEVEYAMGAHEAAYVHMQVHKAYYDSVLYRDNLAKINELETRYQTEQKERELAENALLLAKNETELRTQQLQIGSLAALMIILILFGFLFYRHIRNKQQAQIQLALIDEQQRGLEAVFEATEEERKRIASDLHDGIGQQLAAIKRQAETFSGDLAETDDRARQLKLLIDETAQETRSISHRMMPRSLTELGLIPAVEDLLNKSFSSTNIDLSFEHFNLKERYPEKMEIALYRILQELIQNIFKHAEASSVSIQLYEANKELHLLVEDNGRGFAKGSSPMDGHGLRNIRNRVQTLKGQVQYSNESTPGTTVTVNLPLS